MGSNCCKGEAAARPIRSNSSIYSRSRAGASLDDRFTASDDAGGVRLIVKAARTGDSGVYTLQASNAAGKDTAQIRLEVSPDEAPTGDDPPTFLRRLQDLTVKVGTRTRFLVEIVSSTECKVTWYRNERRLMEAERVSLARDGNFWCADVATVTVDDAGRWTCTAENAGGRASCSAHLNVLVPKAYKRPEFVEELRALLTEQGTVSLECKVVGVPTPILRWFKDSCEIKAGDVFALTANAEDPTSLGTYTCEAVNCMGRAYSSSKVHVVGRGSREGSARPSSSGVAPEPPPIFTKELEEQFVRISEPLTLSCHIVVPPWPRSVVWYNKEGKIEAGERYHVLEDGVGGYLLEVPSAEWADEGEWKCVATSAGGRVGISTCFVGMDVPKNYRKPRFMENLQAVLTEEGLVSFECKVVGFPTPVLSWFKDGQELKPGDVYQLTGTNSLGSYCCIAKNCMGQASSSAELTVEDIQNQLNEEEKLQLFTKNQAPKFILGLKSVEAKIDEPFRFTIKVAIPPEPSVLWYRDDQPVDESSRCHLGKEDRGAFFLDIQNLEFLDQAEWKCVAMNDFGHSVTSCFLKLIIPRHYKKPRFLENLQAILSEEGAVNLECKVIGVPQPILKWYKDGEELKPGDIHRIISGQDGTCCLGTYTCEAQNCMGIAASSASLLGFEDSVKANKKKAEEQALQRNLSLSTIHEERTSQMYDTPIGDITLDDKGEISFSFDGKEVSVSLYETPDLTEEEALQIVEMYADQLSENVTEHNVVELPPLRFVKETSTSGNLLMEAIIIDVSPEYFVSPEEDLRTEADIEDISIADENGPPLLSLDQDVGGEDYLEKTMAILSEEKSDIPKKMGRKKSDSQKSVDDFFSLSRDHSLSEEKKDDETQVLSASDLQSFASAHSLGKPESKISISSAKEGLDYSEFSKTIISPSEPPIVKPKSERRSSRASRQSSSDSEQSFSKFKEEPLQTKAEIVQPLTKPKLTDEEFIIKMTNISCSLSKVINDVQTIERDIILKSELMSSAATASRSLEIINSIISPISEIQSIAEAVKESVSESKQLRSTLFNNLPQPLKALQQSLTIIEKCIDVESDNKTLVKKTCVAFIELCGIEIQKLMSEIKSVTNKTYLLSENKTLSEVDLLTKEITTVIKFSADTIKTRNLLFEAVEIKVEEPSFEVKHLKETQKAVHELRSPLNALLCIIESAECGKVANVTKFKNSEIILNDMSASIQDLQTALEQIESLSVKESTTSLLNYNTEIIETVMESVLELRCSFEQLSTETRNEDDETDLKQALTLIKHNLNEISSKIDTVENKIGKFDILQSDNKLEVLQKMAQILIALENNIQRLEKMPEIKSNMNVFHKCLTKVLENVIESNDSIKYFALIEICVAVNRINASIRNVDSDNILCLASFNNTLRIVQEHFINNIFESELNCSILSNITDILIAVQEAINHAEEISLHIDTESAQDIPTETYNLTKANVLLEHMEKTIAAISKVKSIETTSELNKILAPTFENISPILEELKRSIASTRQSSIEQDQHISEITDTSLDLTLATPLRELNQNIVIINQMIVENVESIKESSEVIAIIAESLYELHTTLEVLQQDVISQHGKDLTPYEVSINIACAVENLQTCIVMIEENVGVDAVDEMSTLEDISGIKTTADTIPSDRLLLPNREEIAIEESLEGLNQETLTSATAQALHTLNEHLTILQNPEILYALDSLSEISDYSSLKSVTLGIGELHAGIEEILQPVLVESSDDLANFVNTSKLIAIAAPMQELQQCLSVLDMNNIPVYENILEMPTGKLHSVFQSISEFKKHLNKCLGVLFPAMETADKTIEVSNKIKTLREVCQRLKDVICIAKSMPFEPQIKAITALEEIVDNLLDVTDVSRGIKIDKVKCITKELYQKVLTVEEEMIQFTTQDSEKLAQEAKLTQTVDEVERNIAVLEQFDFIDLSQVSDITSCTSPQIALETESDSLKQISHIAETAVNVVQVAAQETSIADLAIIEDFFKTCKNKFSIIQCLLTKQLSHKKIIRLLQEFNSLRGTVNNFKCKRFEFKLSEDVNKHLTTFFTHANECFDNLQDSLIRIVDSQSELLFKIPLLKLENTKEILNEVSESKTPKLSEVAQKFLTIFEAIKPCLENAEIAVIDELHSESRSETDEKVLVNSMEDIETYINNEIKIESLDAESRKLLKTVSSCIQKHTDYKDAIGTGKALILLKCFSECSDILQEHIHENKKQTKPTMGIHKLEDSVLKRVLADMLEPLQVLHSQLINVQEQISSGVEEDSISVEMLSTDSLVQTVTEIQKDIFELEHQILAEGSAIDDEEMSVIIEVDKEIQTIQDSIRCMENSQASTIVKDISKPIEDIGKSLHNILTTDKVIIECKEMARKGKHTDLLQSIDQYIESIEIVEEISAVIRIEDLKKSVQIAKELRENIVTSETNLEKKDGEINDEALKEQICLAQTLQKALLALQVQVIDSAQEFASALNSEKLQRIAKVFAQLLADLVAVAGEQVAIKGPKDSVTEVTSSIEALKINEKSAQMSMLKETAVAESLKPVILEQVGTVEIVQAISQVTDSKEKIEYQSTKTDIDKTITQQKEDVDVELAKTISESIQLDILQQPETVNEELFKEHIIHDLHAKKSIENVVSEQFTTTESLQPIILERIEVIENSVVLTDKATVVTEVEQVIVESQRVVTEDEIKSLTHDTKAETDQFATSEHLIVTERSQPFVLEQIENEDKVVPTAEATVTTETEKSAIELRQLITEEEMKRTLDIKVEIAQTEQLTTTEGLQSIVLEQTNTIEDKSIPTDQAIVAIEFEQAALDLQQVVTEEKVKLLTEDISLETAQAVTLEHLCVTEGSQPIFIEPIDAVDDKVILTDQATVVPETTMPTDKLHQSCTEEDTKHLIENIKTEIGQVIVSEKLTVTEGLQSSPIEQIDFTDDKVLLADQITSVATEITEKSAAVLTEDIRPETAQAIVSDHLNVTEGFQGIIIEQTEALKDKVMLTHQTTVVTETAIATIGSQQVFTEEDSQLLPVNIKNETAQVVASEPFTVATQLIVTEIDTASLTKDKATEMVALEQLITTQNLQTIALEQSDIIEDKFVLTDQATIVNEIDQAALELQQVVTGEHTNLLTEDISLEIAQAVTSEYLCVTEDSQPIIIEPIDAVDDKVILTDQATVVTETTMPTNESHQSCTEEEMKHLTENIKTETDQVVVSETLTATESLQSSPIEQINFTDDKVFPADQDTSVVTEITEKSAAVSIEDMRPETAQAIVSDHLNVIEGFQGIIIEQTEVVKDKVILTDQATVVTETAIATIGSQLVFTEEDSQLLPVNVKTETDQAVASEPFTASTQLIVTEIDTASLTKDAKATEMVALEHLITTENMQAIVLEQSDIIEDKVNLTDQATMANEIEQVALELQQVVTGENTKLLTEDISLETAQAVTSEYLCVTEGSQPIIIELTDAVEDKVIPTDQATVVTETPMPTNESYQSFTEEDTEHLTENIKTETGLAVVSETLTTIEGLQLLPLEQLDVKNDKVLPADQITSVATEITEKLTATTHEIVPGKDAKSLTEEVKTESAQIITSEQLAIETVQSVDVEQTKMVKSKVLLSDQTNVNTETKKEAAESQELVTREEIKALSEDIRPATIEIMTEGQVAVLETTEFVILEEAKAIKGLVAPTEINAVVTSDTLDKAVASEVPAVAVDNITPEVQPASERCGLIEHIEEFISDQTAQLVDEFSTVTNMADLKYSVAIAKELRESMSVIEIKTGKENTDILMENIPSEQVQLMQKLQDALSTLQTQLDTVQEISHIINPKALKQVTDIIIPLKEKLAVAIVTHISEDIKTASLVLGAREDTIKENTMEKLETLLQDVSEKIDLLSTVTSTTEDKEGLRDTLDEVQTVIIKLKRDFDGVPNDTLNETLEDLECSVRSVQLQINEDSPPEFLKEACATLQLLTNNMKETQKVHVCESISKKIEIENILVRCTEETDETVKLLDIASSIDTKDQSKLNKIVYSLNDVTDAMKTLRLNFLGNSEMLIEKGIEIFQTLDQIEDKVFSLEKDIAAEQSFTAATRDSIIIAVHSVFSSISNMRSTVSSIQKQYMYDNYAKPSENILKSIKDVFVIFKTDDELIDKTYWKSLSKSLRNVLNHFEDIKFYVNLDKTARLPSDAAFTKIILEDLRSNISRVILPLTSELGIEVTTLFQNTIKCIDTNLLSIESRSSLEVKEKIPIFKEISIQIFRLADSLKDILEERTEKKNNIKKEKDEVEQEKISVDILEDTKTEHTLETIPSTSTFVSGPNDIIIDTDKIKEQEGECTKISHKYGEALEGNLNNVHTQKEVEKTSTQLISLVTEKNEFKQEQEEDASKIKKPSIADLQQLKQDQNISLKNDNIQTEFGDHAEIQQKELKTTNDVDIKENEDPIITNEEAEKIGAEEKHKETLLGDENQQTDNINQPNKEGNYLLNDESETSKTEPEKNQKDEHKLGLITETHQPDKSNVEQNREEDEVGQGINKNEVNKLKVKTDHEEMEQEKTQLTNQKEQPEKVVAEKKKTEKEEIHQKHLEVEKTQIQDEISVKEDEETYLNKEMEESKRQKKEEEQVCLKKKKSVLDKGKKKSKITHKDEKQTSCNKDNEDMDSALIDGIKKQNEKDEFQLNLEDTKDKKETMKGKVEKTCIDKDKEVDETNVQVVVMKKKEDEEACLKEVKEDISKSNMKTRNDDDREARIECKRIDTEDAMTEYPEKRKEEKDILQIENQIIINEKGEDSIKQKQEVPNVVTAKYNTTLEQKTMEKEYKQEIESGKTDPKTDKEETEDNQKEEGNIEVEKIEIEVASFTKTKEDLVKTISESNNTEMGQEKVNATSNLQKEHYEKDGVCQKTETEECGKNQKEKEYKAEIERKRKLNDEVDTCQNKEDEESMSRIKQQVEDIHLKNKQENSDGGKIEAEKSKTNEKEAFKEEPKKDAMKNLIEHVEAEKSKFQTENKQIETDVASLEIPEKVENAKIESETKQINEEEDRILMEKEKEQKALTKSEKQQKKEEKTNLQNEGTKIEGKKLFEEDEIANLQKEKESLNNVKMDKAQSKTDNEKIITETAKMIDKKKQKDEKLAKLGADEAKNKQENKLDFSIVKEKNEAEKATTQAEVKLEQEEVACLKEKQVADKAKLDDEKKQIEAEEDRIQRESEEAEKREINKEKKRIEGVRLKNINEKAEKTKTKADLKQKNNEEAKTQQEQEEPEKAKVDTKMKQKKEFVTSTDKEVSEQSTVQAEEKPKEVVLIKEKEEVKSANIDTENSQIETKESWATKEAVESEKNIMLDAEKQQKDQQESATEKKEAEKAKIEQKKAKKKQKEDEASFRKKKNEEEKMKIEADQKQKVQEATKIEKGMDEADISNIELDKKQNRKYDEQLRKTAEDSEKKEGEKTQTQSTIQEEKIGDEITKIENDNKQKEEEEIEIEKTEKSSALRKSKEIARLEDEAERVKRESDSKQKQDEEARIQKEVAEKAYGKLGDEKKQKEDRETRIPNKKNDAKKTTNEIESKQKDKEQLRLEIEEIEKRNIVIHNNLKDEEENLNKKGTEIIKSIIEKKQKEEKGEPKKDKANTEDRNDKNNKKQKEQTLLKEEKDFSFYENTEKMTRQNTREQPRDLEACEKAQLGTSFDELTVSRKYDYKEKPKFIDHNNKDYTMEFIRPSGYREKSFGIDVPSLERESLRNSATIYKAHTLVMDAQLRSSLPPSDTRSSEPFERRSEIRHKSKALSETRCVLTEKRQGLSRQDIKRKPVFSTYLTDRTAVEGSRVKLTCSVLSSSDPIITWYKNGVELDNKLKYCTKFVDGLITLEVLNAVPNDSAEYSCTVSNENGSVSSLAQLKVYPSFEASPIPPTFTRSIRDTYHLAENELVLECRIRGQPLPTITWLKDDKPITPNEHYQAYYLAEGVCRLAVISPTPEDSGKYTCKAENSVWSDQITHVVSFTGKERRLSPNLTTVESYRFNRQALESRRPHFGNVLSDYKVSRGGTIGLQVEIRGSPTRVEWLREGSSVTETYRNAKTFVEHGLYILALSDVTEKESGTYTCRAWSSHGNVDMNAAITVVHPNELEGKPAIIVGHPEKDVLLSVGEDLNISFRVQGEPKPKIIFMKGTRDITNNQRVCKMTSDDYVKFTLKRSVVSDAGTYCIFARNIYGCDRVFVTVVIRQRATSENLISDWTYHPMDDSALSIADRYYKCVPDRIPGEPTVVDGGNNWVSLAWQKPDSRTTAPVLAYKVESWLAGKEGGARWTELGITPLNSFDAFNLKQGEEYHFRVTPRNRYGWGESVQTTTPISVGSGGNRPEFIEILPGQMKVLVGETANLSCSVKGKPTPEIVWLKNGHEIEEENGRIKTLFNGYNCSLTINDVHIEDEARYSCEATNVHGRASTYVRLAVVTDKLIWEADVKLKRERSAGADGEYPPQFTMRLRDRRVQATYPVRLTCQVVGSPSPAITWYKDGEELTLDTRHMTYQDENFHTVEIAPTTLDDGGVYEALARNSSGAVSCRCSLVVDKGIRAYVAPEFCCGLEPLYRLTEGEELRISAVVEAYPSVGVTWYRDGVRLRPSRRAVMTLDREGQIELALAFVTPRDAGVYTCTASNEVGRASTSGKVEVIEGQHTIKKRTTPAIVSPDVPYSKEPMFVRKPRSSEAREGDTVIIECEVVGDPKPDVFWLRDFLKPDYYRDSTHFKRVGEGPEYRFEIPHAKLDYTGAYSVVARNIHGEAKAVISLQILAKDLNSNEESHNIRYGRVEVIPRFERELTDLLCHDGDAIEFECRVSGNPEPYVRWFHYTELIRECPDFETSFEDGTARFKIKQVTAEDEGTYACEAINCLGKATSTACLVVYPPGEPNMLSQRLRRPPALLSAASTPRSTPRSTPARSVSRTPGPDTRQHGSPSRQMPPKFYTYPYNKVVDEGANVTFKCAVNGLPSPWATWDKDGVILTPSTRITIKEKDTWRILQLDEVTVDDVGLYRVTLENDFGRAEASARLEIISHKGKFYAGVRAYSASPRRSLPYRKRLPSSSRKD